MFRHKYHPHHKLAGSALIAMGAITMALGSQLQMEAQLIDQLTGKGAFMADRMAAEPMLMAQPVLFPAAITAPNSGGVIAFGMLMMLLGFGLHAWIVLQNEEDRSVKVRAGDPRKRKAAPKPVARKSRKPMEVIWVERTIRF
jgi:hypothetical protein